MKKRNRVIGVGILLCLVMAVSVWHAVTFNDSRLVVPMDAESYVFQIRDLPMVVSIVLVCVYVLYLFIILCRAILRQKQAVTETNKTRKLNPKLGYLGFLGFLGFVGFWTYHVNRDIFPFVFFLFFGFFGFYYEGKMSGTFMDERFRENAKRAQLAAFKIVYIVLFIGLLVLCSGRLLGNWDYTLIAAVILLAVALALGMFLSEYLLYRYDHDESCGETDLDDDDL